MCGSSQLHCISVLFLCDVDQTNGFTSLDLARNGFESVVSVRLDLFIQVSVTFILPLLQNLLRHSMLLLMELCLP